ncbi:MAG: molybdopterin-dependent oxidoreductase [Chloroflexi bacterium]|nr:molybdopterin-dependent oxidoreductase [Chloroflexota bacterium]
MKTAAVTGAPLSTGTRYLNPRRPGEPGERIVTGTCPHDCGGRCIVNAHVRDGRIVRISTQPGPWKPHDPPLHACVRGFATLDRTYAPDRLKYPLRRTGPRGSGEFKRISWEEALDEVAGQMLRVRDTHGPEAILDCSSAGSTSILHNRNVLQRLLFMFGGCTDLWGNMSREAEVFAFRHTFGEYDGTSEAAGRGRADYANSKLMILWGWTPGDNTFGTGTLEYLKWARKNGVRMVCVDPRVTHTSAVVADEHIFIRPSTDTAMLVALAHVIVRDDLHDRRFLDRHVLGFDEDHLPPDAPANSSYRSYLMGLADGVPKTPEWAEEITGVPADRIVSLAREFATNRPAALHCGFAPGRTAFGEQFHRAAFALAALTGNIGIPGGNTGRSLGCAASVLPGFPKGTNPISSSVHVSFFADLLSRGRAGGYPADIRLVYSAFGHLLNQAPNSGKAARALADERNVEFIVVHEHFMTPMARFADILLPAAMLWERNDVNTPWGNLDRYAIFMKQAIEPVHECRTDLDICSDLAERLGISGYNDRPSDVDWLRELCKGTAIDDFEAFQENGLARFPFDAGTVAFAQEIGDPDNHPFRTPSGKIELYSATLARKPDVYGLGRIPAVPTYVAEEPLDSRYPLRLVSPTSRARTHSQYPNLPRLARIDPQTAWIHPQDAAPRGIRDGQPVRVFNDYGECVLPAEVTDRIAPGIVCMKAGAWYAPDETGVDRGGCPNTLTVDRPSPAGAQTHNTCSVEVSKWRPASPPPRDQT